MSLDIERAQSILVLCGLAAVAKYLFSEGQFSPRALLANIFMAAALGWAAVLISEGMNLLAWQAGFIAGALCWLGPTAITAALKKFLQTYSEPKK